VKALWLTIYGRLEERRKVKGAAYYERKKAQRKHLAEARKSTADHGSHKKLAELGY
jgi:large subunit ribosomal protein L13Ae